MTRIVPNAPGPVRRIVRTLEDAGFETWAVGGAVRDVLLGLPGGDWDLTTRARPQQVRRLFRRTVPIGIDHGTVGVLLHGVMYEVTTFRRDVETDGRHAVVAFADTVEEDLARRDFTINAIAWHPSREVLLDPFHGVEDLEARILRAVGDAQKRFSEDYLRVLRALRFAGRFGLDVEEGTWTALSRAAEHLPTLSAERIREELLKVLDADAAPSAALGLYASSGALASLYPELDAHRLAAPDAWTATLATVDRLPRARPFQRLAALLHGLDGARVAQLLVRLRLSNAQCDETARRVAAPPLPPASAADADVRTWLSRVGRERFAGVSRVQLARARATGDPVAAARVVEAWRRARGILGTEPPLNVRDLAIDGRDLIRLGLKPGPGFGKILETLLDWVLEDPARNDAAGLRERALELADATDRASGV